MYVDWWFAGINSLVVSMQASFQAASKHEMQVADPCQFSEVCLTSVLYEDLSTYIIGMNLPAWMRPKDHVIYHDIHNTTFGFRL
jgi:hypothetical protein